MGTAKGDGYTITPRDLELIINAINCTRLPFEVEYDELARRLGYKNGRSAKAAWNALKKKLDKVAEGAPVVPSLTIDPEPLRRVAGSSPRAEGSGGKKKGKRPVVDPLSESSDESSGDESDEVPVQKSKLKLKGSKHRKQPRVVDDDGDVSMAEDQSRSPKPRHKKSKKSGSKDKNSPREVNNRRKTAVSTTSASEFSSESESARERVPPTPRKKLKRKFTHLAVRDLPASAMGKASGAGSKAFEAFARPGAEDEDDEEVEQEPPPPAYVKREGWSGDEGVR